MKMNKVNFLKIAIILISFKTQAFLNTEFTRTYCLRSKGPIQKDVHHEENIARNKRRALKKDTRSIDQNELSLQNEPHAQIEAMSHDQAVVPSNGTKLNFLPAFFVAASSTAFITSCQLMWSYFQYKHQYTVYTTTLFTLGINTLRNSFGLDTKKNTEIFWEYLRNYDFQGKEMASIFVISCGVIGTGQLLYQAYQRCAKPKMISPSNQ